MSEGWRNVMGRHAGDVDDTRKDEGGKYDEGGEQG